MPENEFELYLSLLGRFLRLKPAQRGEIADELRDHLEARLEELSSQGLSRDQAIRAALDEFGDAAELATHFTRIARTRKRRLIMRCTAGSIAALGAVILMSWAFAPGNTPVNVPQIAVAQIGGAGAGDAGSGFGGAPGSQPGTKPAATAAVTSDADRNAVEGKLAKRIKMEIAELPLEETFNFISEQIGVDILINRAVLADEGIQLDTPTTLKIKYAEVTARTALDLLLEPHHLSYTIRDGLIVITTSDQASEIQVYNCSDLISSRIAGILGSGAMPGGEAMVGGGMPGGMAPAMGGMMGMGSGGGGMFGGPTQVNSLADVIMTTIDPGSWQIAGGNGSITEYSGLLIVKGSQTVHIKVRQLLDMMRVATQIGPPTSPAATPGAMGSMGGARG